MKKWIAVGLAVLMTAASLTGCGESKKNNADVGQTTAVGGTTAEVSENGKQETSEAPYLITMTMEGEQQEDFPRIMERVNEILVRDLNMKLNLIILPWGTSAQQKQLMLTGGEALDIVDMANISQAISYMNNGQIINISELIDESAPNIRKFWGDEFAKNVKVGDFVMGIPAFRPWGSRPCVGMRKDMVEKYEIDTSSIKTIEDMTAIYEMIKEKEPTMTPVYLAPDQPAASSQLGTIDTLADGIAVLDHGGLDTATVIPITQSESYRQALKTIREWYVKGYVNPDAATTTVGFESAFKSGDAFSALMVWHPLSPGQFGGVDMVYAMLGDHKVFSIDTVKRSFGIASNSKDPKKAMEMLDYLYQSEEVAQLLNWGEEGIDWVYKDKAKNVATYPEGKDSGNSVYHAVLTHALPNFTLCSTWDGVYTEDAWEQCKKFNQEGIKSKAFGFLFNPDEVANELTALQNVKDKYGASLECGAVDPEEYLAKYEEELNQAGLDKLIESKQKQLDAYLNSK